MSDPTNLLGVLAIAAAFLALAGIATYRDHRRHPKTPAPTRQAAQGPRVGVGSTVPYHCATYGHYFVRRYSDRWRCAKCGVLSDIVAVDTDAIEAHANGEAS